MNEFSDGSPRFSEEDFRSRWRKSEELFPVVAPKAAPGEDSRKNGRRSTIPLPSNPSRKGVEKQRELHRIDTFPSGIALMDAPNIRCVLHGELGRAPYGSEDLDLKCLRSWHKNVLMIRKCHFVVRPDPARRRAGLRDAVRRGNWRWVRCERARYGYNDDPVDDYIIHRLVELTDQFNIHQQNTISLISHDGGYAQYLERFVDAGGYVAIVGFKDRLSKRLAELANHERVVLFDLDDDVHAVNHHERTKFANVG